MSQLLTRMQAQLLATPLPLNAQVGAQAIAQMDGFQSEPIALYNGSHDREEFSLDCLLRVVKIQGKAELLSRVNYYFPKGITVSAQNALDCANQLNTRLVNSRVCVVQNIDGDGRFALRMDTLLQGAYEANNIANFLEKVTSDVARLLEYFSEYLPTLSAKPAIEDTLSASYGAPPRLFFRQSL
jgi:hypothetical protein